jgi:pteridine reductase
MSTARQVALVTGSGKRRIGWHVADALAGRGYAIAVHYHRSARDAKATVSHLRQRNVDAEAFHADLAAPGAATELASAVLKRFGRLDVLVHCAAIWERQPLEQVTAADFLRNFEINTLGTCLLSQHVGLAMAAQPEGGNIILLGDWAIERPYLHHLPYFVSKGTIPTLTRALAVELGTRNPRVRVNCILPGPVMLPGDLPANEREASIRGTLLKREGRPENVAQAVLFLIENDYVTGVCLPVDGGRTIYGEEL